MPHFDRFLQYWPNYILQIFAITLVNYFLLMALDIKPHDVVIVSVAATVFTVFTAPNKPHTDARHILGGSAIAIAVGLLFSSIARYWLDHPEISFYTMALPICGSMAIGMHALLSVLSKTMHTPSCALTLGLVVIDWDLRILISCVIVIVLVTVCRHLFGRYMINL